MNTSDKPVLRVVAGIINRDGKFLIGKRKLGKHLAGKWEFPGGKIEEGETPEECMVREFQEEFDVLVSAGLSVGENIVELEDRIIHLFGHFGEYLSGDFVLKEHDEVRWVTGSELSSYDFASADIPFLEKLL